MESLVERAAVALARHPAPAVPFHEVVALARGSGMAINESILLQSLRAAPQRFRVLGPWRGRWSALPREAWLVPLGPGDRPPPPCPCLERMRAGLVWLGRELDDRSARDVARWLALVGEGEAVRSASA